MNCRFPLAAATFVLLASCFGPALPTEPGPLADLDEPPALHAEPDDETARRDLPPGGFTGVYVEDARASLDALAGAPEGVAVRRIVENSPADAAGLRPGDLLLEVRRAAGPPVAIAWPSEWRRVELDAKPGEKLRVTYDRAGIELEAEVVVEARLHVPGREPSRRFREEQRVGVVVRTATEVEARRAGLGPGAGAVVVGLSRRSPWRARGIRFGDLLVAIDGHEISHPQVVLDVIRSAEPGRALAIRFVRNGELHRVEVPLSRRAHELTDIQIPLLFSYESDRGTTEVSLLLGLFGYRSTPVAWRLRLLWLIEFGGGDADRLVEVGR